MYQRLQRPLVLTETDAQIVRPYTGLYVLLCYNGRTTVRPYMGLYVLLYYNGRTDRASLQPLLVQL